MSEKQYTMETDFSTGRVHVFTEGEDGKPLDLGGFGTGPEASEFIRKCIENASGDFLTGAGVSNDNNFAGHGVDPNARVKNKLSDNIDHMLCAEYDAKTGIGCECLDPIAGEFWIVAAPNPSTGTPEYTVMRLGIKIGAWPTREQAVKFIETYSQAPQPREEMPLEAKLLISIKHLRSKAAGMATTEAELETVNAIADMAAMFILTQHSMSQGLNRVAETMEAQTKILSVAYNLAADEQHGKPEAPEKQNLRAESTHVDA